MTQFYYMGGKFTSPSGLSCCLIEGDKLVPPAYLLFLLRACAMWNWGAGLILSISLYKDRTTYTKLAVPDMKKS